MAAWGGLCGLPPTPSSSFPFAGQQGGHGASRRPRRDGVSRPPRAHRTPRAARPPWPTRATGAGVRGWIRKCQQRFGGKAGGGRRGTGTAQPLLLPQADMEGSGLPLAAGSPGPRGPDGPQVIWGRGAPSLPSDPAGCCALTSPCPLVCVSCRACQDCRGSRGRSAAPGSPVCRDPR